MTLQTGPSHRSNLDLWKFALRFYFRHLMELLPLFPILFIPIWTDCYHSVLIRQLIARNNTLQPMRAIGKTMRLLPDFALTKLTFFLPALLWGFIPIIGWYKDFTYRLKWAMASNVHVFEKSDVISTRERCNQLMNSVIEMRRTDALMIIPIILYAVIMTLVAVLVTLIHSTVFFWIGMFFLAWIVLPGSAIVNTLVYLSVAKNSAFEELVGRSSHDSRIIIFRSRRCP